MSGHARPHSTAFAPSDLRGFDMLEEAFKGSVFRKLDETALGKSWRLEREKKRQSAPATVFADIPSSDEGSSLGSELEQVQDEGFIGPLVAKASGDRVGLEAAQDVGFVKPLLADSSPQHPDLDSAQDGAFIGPLLAGSPRVPLVVEQPGAKFESIEGSIADEPSERRIRSQTEAPARRLVTPPQQTAAAIALPPTPPTMANSDDNEPRATGLAADPNFANDVREALRKKSGLSMSGQHLPTPEPSPPATTGAPASPLLRPTFAALKHHASSRAESFHTAREDPNQSQLNLLRAQTPEEGLLDNAWLRTSRNGLPQQQVDNESPESLPSEVSEAGKRDRDLTPTPKHRMKRDYSPDLTPGSTSDFDKHISYIDDDSIPYFMQTSETPHNGPQDHTLNSTEHSSVESMNNQIYKQIQEENVKRHSLLSNGNAVAAGIYIPSSPQRAHTLKRTARHEALRDVSDSGVSQHHSEPPVKQLRRKSAHIQPRSLDASPTFDADSKPRRLPRVDERRVVTDPMTRLTQAEMTSAVMPSPLFYREPKLRHSSRGSRLENRSPSSRRDSGEITDHGVGMVPLHDVTIEHSGSKTLRHFSRDAQLDRNESIKRASPDVQRYDSPDMHPGFEAVISSSRLSRRDDSQRAVREPDVKTITSIRSAANTSDERHDKQHTLHHFPRTAKLENNTHVRRGSLETHGSPRALHSQHNSLDLRMLHPITTPGSVSAFSDQTAVEVCEAKGVTLYPHHNESLLVVQHAFKPTLAPQPILVDQYDWNNAKHYTSLLTPTFAATVEEPSPQLSQRDMNNFIDSPLTHPRTAPEPPAFRVIPPTPSQDQDSETTTPRQSIERPDLPVRRPSLIQRARRFSESVIDAPLFNRSLSLRSNKVTRRAVDDSVARPKNLSPLWQPRRFWDGYDSEEELYDDEDLDGLPFAPDGHTRLPEGGDTSSISSQKRAGQRRLLFPRNMSVRMPGFRGEGGFLVGNSLGISRWGSNNRRPHVAVVRKSSVGGLHTGAGSGGKYVSQGSGIRRRASEEWLGQGGTGARTRGGGVRKLRERMGRLRGGREEDAAEKRRREIRGSIVHAEQE
ncbi:hypothetical protein LTR78_003366 [Recurvomyces mirabilis]|uniref:Uncharacterized protein n=1 Tax=Recurvomyces mirabilis TaxID=574656 RepID=A0AAE1C3B7_9PEZI|nr:hypothetical protein LTR78_003366 [Recurvomyces mirabilis]KAK5154598.1 hypothetical protein LTS14_006736 [Recurvomyces mirabilis]